jgi:hypothetical protein
MVWALDQEDKNSRSSSKDLIGDQNKFPNEAGDGSEDFYTNRAIAYHSARDYGLSIFWTECQPYLTPRCPSGFYALTYGHGKVYDADFGHVVADGCHGGGNGWNRALCAPLNLKGNSCGWFGKAKKCNTKCPKGYYRISQNSHIAYEKTGCQSGRYANYCCKELSSYNLDQCYDDRYVVGQLLTGGTSSGGLDKRGTNLFNPQPCNIANLDNFFYNEHPGWFGAGVEGHFSMQGNRAIWEPASTLQNDQPQATRELRGQTFTVAIESTTTETTSKVCDGSRTVQACHHYSSVCRRNPAFSTLICPARAPSGNRPAVNSWNRQHDRAWSSSWIPRRLDCERDEFPFFRFWGQNTGAWIRLMPGRDNSDGGNLPNRVCDEQWKTQTGQNLQGGPINQVGDRYITTVYRTDTVTISALVLSFTNCDRADDAIPINQCNPTILTDDRGFALLTNDPWYRAAANRHHNKGAYEDPPSAALTNGHSPVNRRDWLPDELIFDMGNSSRRASDEEIFEKHGLVRCASDDCAEEARALGLSFTLPALEDDLATEIQTATLIDSPAVATSTEQEQSTLEVVPSPQLASPAPASPASALGSSTPMPTQAAAAIETMEAAQNRSEDRRKRQARQHHVNHHKHRHVRDS